MNRKRFLIAFLSALSVFGVGAAASWADAPGTTVAPRPTPSTNDTVTGGTTTIPRPTPTPPSTLATPTPVPVTPNYTG